MSIKKKPVTRAVKQATMSILFSACARVACRTQSMQTIIFDDQCDSVSSTDVEFRNHAAEPQHPLPILIIDGEKIILLYPTFTYISSHCQKYLHIFILGLRPARLLFCSMLLCLKSFTVTRYTNCFEVLLFFICF